MTLVNTIERLYLEVNTPSLKSANGFKDAIDDYINDVLLPLLENYLEDFPQLKNQQINLNFLEFSIDISQKDWQFELKTQWERQLGQHLGVLIEKESVAATTIVKTGTGQEPLLYFLRTGILPWWIELPAGASAMDAWIYKQLESEPLRRKLIAQAALPLIRSRLIKQFKDGFLLSLLDNSSLKGTYWSQPKKQLWSSFIADQKRGHRAAIWEALLLLHIEKTEISEQLQRQLTGLLHVNQQRAQSEKTHQILAEFKLLSQLSPNIRARGFTTNLKAGIFSKRSEIDAPETAQTAGASIDENTPENNQNTVGKTASATNGEQSQSAIVDKVLNTSESATRKTSDSDTPARQQHTSKQEETASSIDVSQGKNAVDSLAKADDGAGPKISKTEKEKGEGADREKNFTEMDFEMTALLQSGFESKQNKEQAMYMPNCGFLLIHPFLSRFLKNCELLDENGKLKDKTKTAELLYYTATGRQSAYEHQLHFFKFLCDIPQGYPLDRAFELSLELQEKSDELLAAVLGHLPQLGSSSVSLLRNEFLTREGKLTLGKTDKILVARKTQDLLLQNVPWNLSVIKLPWLKKLIHMQW